MLLDWVIAGGLISGALAGGAARFGRLCTMSAIEDALVARDFRGAKAWGLAAAVAVLSTQLLIALGVVDLSGSLLTMAPVHVFGALLGGLLFGIGMTFVGTCAFGLLVRAGSGDLRAAVSAIIVGVVAMASTAGVLSRVRLRMFSTIVVDAGGWPSSLKSGFATGGIPGLIAIAIAALCVALIVLPLLDSRMRRRPRLLIGAAGLGLAIALGWLMTSLGVAALVLDRPHSLSFVAPVGRALLQAMMEPFRDLGFGVASAAGVVAASAAVAWWRDELRWEAFDDPVEMRRHMLGAALMGFGGVLAQGCTIGQGMSALSAVALSAPAFIIAVLAGAKIGLGHLIEGRSIWRLGR